MPKRSIVVRPFGRHRIAGAAVLAAALAAAPPAAAQQPTALAPPQTIAGPSLSDVALGGLSIARDGTGGLAYVAGENGADHVYVSRLVGGSFQPAQELDANLPAGSSQPVIAAGNGGVLLVAFVNGGELYVSDLASASPSWGAPQPLYANAQSPSISMSNFGKAYLAFTATEAGGHDVRVAYYAGGTWTNVGAALNQTPGDDAGTGTGRPAAAAAGDGVGIVTWGEGGHILARRVWGLSPSVLVQRLDPATFDGATEIGAGDPALSVGGDSSYVDIAYLEQLAGGGGQSQTRALLTRLIAEDVGPTVAADGLRPGGGDAAQPAVAMNEYGRGFATATQLAGDSVVATALATNGVPAAQSIVGSGGGQVPSAVPGLAGLSSTLIAWWQASASNAQVMLLRAPGDGTLEAPLAVSDPVPAPAPSSTPPGGASTPGSLDAAGDVDGDAAVAWVQGAPGAQSIEVARQYVPPGQAAPLAGFAYSRQAQVTLGWSPAREAWGPLTYTVSVDGAVVGQTSGTSLALPSALTDGPHVWQVAATNPGGLTSAGARGTVFVDTVPPRLRVVLTGRHRAHRRLVLRVTALDVPPPQPGATGSGVRTVTVSWGDRTRALSTPPHKRLTHAYAAAGIYRLTVRAVDRAGNATVIARYIRILP